MMKLVLDEKRNKLNQIGDRASLRAFLFALNVVLNFFTTDGIWEAKLIFYYTVSVAETCVDYCFLTPKRVQNFGVNDGKKVDKQIVDKKKKCCFLHAR